MLEYDDEKDTLKSARDRMETVIDDVENTVELPNGRYEVSMREEVGKTLPEKKLPTEVIVKCEQEK